MGGNSGRGRRRSGNGSGKSEEIKGDFSGYKGRQMHNRPRNGNDRPGLESFVQSLSVEGGSLAEWQPLNNSSSGHRRKIMFRPVVEVDRPNVDRLQSTLQRCGRQGPKGSAYRMDISGKMNNTVGYTYPDPEAVDYSLAVGSGNDTDPNKPHTSENCSQDIAFSTSETEVTTKSVSSHHLSPVTLLPASETRVAVFLDRNPKTPALEYVSYDEGTYNVLSGESTMGLGYHVEETVSTMVDYLEGQEQECEVDPSDASKTVDATNEKFSVKVQSSKQRQEKHETTNRMNNQITQRKYKMQGRGKKGKNVVSNRNDGFLVIGGVRMYTEDVSVSNEEDAAMLEIDTEDSTERPDQSNIVSVSRSKLQTSEFSCTSNLSESGEDSEDLETRSYSDIDDEVAKDYLEGIGGSVSELLDAEFLLDRGALELVSPGEISEEYKEDAVGCESSSEESSDEIEDGEFTLAKLAMKSSSQECRSKTLIGNKKSELQVEQLRENMLSDEDSGSSYGAERGEGFRKRDVNGPQSVGCSDNIEDGLESLLLLKDTRTPLIRKKDKSVRLPQTWPIDAWKTKDKGVPGGKKKHRKQEIAAKRRERTLRRGVDLEAINMSLERMVLNTVDMLAFQPMHSRDCSQVQRLASIYRLKSGRQGSGKKRFVTVARTKHTCMPSANDRVRLLKLLGVDDEMLEPEFKSSSNREKLSGEKSRMDAKVRRAARMAYMSMMQDESFSHEFRKRPSRVAYLLSESAGGSGKKKRSAMRGDRRHVSGYASQPMSFVSSGTMEPDCGIVETGVSIISLAEEEHSASKNGLSFERRSSGNSSKMGSFEVHTKGFGSRMMAKMGFVEGTGLGKDGQGIVEPLEAVKRPKSLGLGL